MFQGFDARRFKKRSVYSSMFEAIYLSGGRRDAMRVRASGIESALAMVKRKLFGRRGAYRVLTIRKVLQ